MHTNGRITLLAAVILLSLPSFAQKVLKGDFKVEVRTMYPQRYPSRMVTDFSLEVKDGEAIVYLPYMGEVYVPSLSSEGLNFTEKMRKLSHQTNTKGQEILYFVLKRHELSYEFVVRTDSNGEADITMRPSNGQQCGYHGDLEVTDVKTNALLNQLPKCAVGSKDRFCDGRLDDLLQHIDGLSYGIIPPLIDLRIISSGIASKDFRKGHDNFKR